MHVATIKKNCPEVFVRGQTYRHGVKVPGLLDLENVGITKLREQFGLPNDTALTIQKFWFFMASLIGSYL